MEIPQEQVILFNSNKKIIYYKLQTICCLKNRASRTAIRVNLPLSPKVTTYTRTGNSKIRLLNIHGQETQKSH